MPALTTRFLLLNHAVAEDNPNVSFALAPPEADPLYPAANALVKDRKIQYLGPGGNSFPDVVAVINLGSNKTVRVVGVMGLDFTTTGPVYPSNIGIRGFNTYPSPSIASVTCPVSPNRNKLTIGAGNFTALGVKVGQRISGHANVNGRTVLTIDTPTQLTMNVAASGTGPDTFTALFEDWQPVRPIGTFSYTGPDVLFVLPANVSYRYYEFTFGSCFAPFLIGKFVAASMVDLGIAFSPGSSETSVLAKVYNRAADQSLRSTTVGPSRKRIDYQFLRVPQTILDAIRTAHASAPFTILTPYGETLEAEPTEGELSTNVVWGTPDLYDVVLSAEQLP